MQIRAIDVRNRRDIRRFVDFPFELYAGNDRWSPPLRSGVRRTLDRKHHPFYIRSDAAFFLAERDGRTLARVAVLDNRRYNDHTGRNAAFFTYFDALDDAAAARGVLDAAGRWAAERGRTTLLGPKGFVRSDAPGLLVEGFEYEAALAMPYNYDYYPRLLEAAGFVKEVDYLSGYLTKGYKLPDRLVRLVDVIKARYGFQARALRSKRELRRWIPALQKINNEAFTHVWGYYPIDEAEARLVARQLLTMADPKLLKIVTKGEEIAGFLFIFPDVSAALRKTRGRLFPLGWITILRALKTTTRMSGNGVGLLPQYQGKGASALLYAEIASTLTAAGATHCDVAQALESNVKSLGDMNMLGVVWHKRHRVYRRTIAGPGSGER
jgi:hypothetical protein